MAKAEAAAEAPAIAQVETTVEAKKEVEEAESEPPQPSKLELELELQSNLEVANTVLMCTADDWPDMAAKAKCRCFLVVGYCGRRGPKKAHLSPSVASELSHSN